VRPAAWLLLAVTAQRLGELAIARRNTRRLLERGAREVAPEHYPAIVALHASWLTGLWLLARNRPVRRTGLAAYLGLTALRAWTLASIGSRWTTRILVVPGETLVRRGPYRFLPHPNYLVVAAEIATLPLTLGRPRYALLFSLLNAAALSVRIRAEEAGLDEAQAEGRRSPPLDV
jgi:methyltransferase